MKEKDSNETYIQTKKKKERKESEMINRQS